MDREGIISFGKDLSAGGISGIVAKTVTAPIERVKLLMQTQGTNADLKIRYKDPWDCFLRVYKEQGFLAFWRGNVAGVLRYFPSHSINFAFKDRYKDFFSSLLETNTKKDFWRVSVCNLSAGGLAGGTAMFAAYPLDLIRTKLAADVGTQKINSLKLVSTAFSSTHTTPLSPSISIKTIMNTDSGHGRRYVGTVDCFSKIIKEGGFLALYRGFPTALGGVILFKALFMGGYDTSKVALNLDGRDSSLTLRFLTAQLITCVAGTVCYPIDSVKRRLMMQGNAPLQSVVTAVSALSSPTHTTYYTSGTHCFFSILREEGVRGLFHGLSVNLIRGIGGAILLVGYDEAKALLKQPSMY